MVEDEIRDGEHRLLLPATRDELDRLISDDFVEFGSSGRIWRKPEIVEMLLGQPAITKPPVLDELRVLEVSPDVALATYRTSRSLRSSVWRREVSGWRIVFHQGTVIPT